MKFGVNINPSKPQVQEIEGVAKWGLDFVELYIEPPFNTHQMLVKKAPLIRKVLADSGLFAVGHAAPYCDLGSPDITIRAAWLIEMKRTIKAAEKLGLKRLDVHAHSSGMGFLTEELDRILMENFITSFAFLVEAARPHGIIISVENTSEHPKEFAHLLAKVPGLHATLDIGHAFMRGGMPAIEAFTKIKAVDHLHINDATGMQDNLPLGKGKINMKKVAEMLKARKYEGTATVEVFGSKTEMKQSLEKFKELMK